MLTVFAASRMTSGSRSRLMPRSQPWPASAISANGSPKALIRR
jgi:hypothetical protein